MATAALSAAAAWHQVTQPSQPVFNRLGLPEGGSPFGGTTLTASQRTRRRRLVDTQRPTATTRIVPRVVALKHLLHAQSTPPLGDHREPAHPAPTAAATAAVPHHTSVRPRRNPGSHALPQRARRRRASRSPSSRYPSAHYSRSASSSAPVRRSDTTTRSCPPPRAHVQPTPS